jgi:hypothetical protein
MIARRHLAGALLLAAGLGLQPAAHAGRPCESPKLSTRTIEQAMNLAERTHQALEASGARVVVIARVGQDLSEYGLRYSHLGLAYRDDAARAWRIVHKLNHCGSNHASVYRQGLAEFFLDDLHEYEAGLVVLRPDVQEALLPLLASNRRVPAMHTRAYNMVAYPWSQRYQQSNQWALETLAHAMDPSAAATRAGAQAWLRGHGYQPTTLRLSTFKRLGARVTSTNVAFDDHPNDRRFAGRIDTVTVDSAFGFLRASGLGGSAQVVR